VSSSTVRCAALSIAFAGHFLLAWPLLSIQPLSRAQITPMPGLLVPGSGYSTDRATVIFIEERGTAREVDRPAPPSLDLAGTVTLRIPPPTTGFPDTSDLEDATGTANAAEPSPVEGNDSAALLEKYVGQIRARIDRAWELPADQRTESCRVRITQGEDGKVVDLQLAECELDDAARKSLIVAVRRASPLPAPPEARLFLSEVSVDFGPR
jgi:hypothetical protein